MSLNVKYRPKNFDQVLGNNYVLDVLKSFTKLDNKPQTYLFYGDHGSGKNTLTYILCNILNCEITELNSNKNRDVKSIRNIYESSKFGTFDGKNKAYIFDEAHQLPSLSQDALLEIFEKPPKNTYLFILTTEINKIRPALKSRCKVFKIEKIRTRELYPYLIDISKKENNEINKEVARCISDTSKGFVRDALNILENVLQVKEVEKQLSIAQKMIVESSNSIDLCRMILNGNWSGCRQILKLLQSENPESIRKIIINYMQKVLLNGGNKENRALDTINCLQNTVYDFSVLCLNIYKIFLN